MTYRTESPYAHEEVAYEADDEEPRRGLLSWLLIIAMLMGTGGASAVVWRTFGGGPILPALASNPIAAVAVAEKPAVAAPAPPPAQGDLAALRQEITGSVQSTQQLLAAQQAEIKRLSEQVSALSSKLELMQRPVASAQAAIPGPAAPQGAAPAAPKKKPEAAKSAAAKPASPKPPKPAADPKPASGGPISTGGAPLQLNR